MTAATGLLLTPLPPRVAHWWSIEPAEDIGLTGPIDMPTPAAEGRFSGELDLEAPATVDGLPRVLAWLVAALAGAALCLWLITLGVPADAAGLLILAAALTTASVPMWRGATL